MWKRHWKSCIWETLILSTCADSSTHTKTDRNIQKHKEDKNCNVSLVVCHMSHVACHVLHVTCHMSPVTCHLSLRQTATATDGPPQTIPLCTVGCFAKTQKGTFESFCCRISLNLANIFVKRNFFWNSSNGSKRKFCLYKALQDTWHIVWLEIGIVWRIFELKDHSLTQWIS